MLIGIAIWVFLLSAAVIGMFVFLRPDYFQLHKRTVRVGIRCVLLLIGSLALYMTIAMSVGIPGAIPNLYLDWMVPAFFLLVALACALGIARTLQRKVLTHRG